MNLDGSYIPTESDVIFNSKEGHLYSHNFVKNGTKGKFFSVVHKNKEGATLQVSSWVQLKVIYIYEKDEITGFEITKLKKNSTQGKYIETSEKIFLSNISLGDIIAFAEFIKSIDLKGISTRRIKLGEDEINIIDDDTKKKLKTLLLTKEGANMVLTLLNEGALTSHDIVNVGYRKKQLLVFDYLLKNKDNWKIYAKKEKEKNEVFDSSKEEKVWQYFFRKNPWIFGYGLDYQYLEILQNESTVRGSDVSGRENEKLDTLAGTSDFTVLVELKKPSTELFDNTHNRSNSWLLSSDLFTAVSQILEYKASHIIEWQDETKRYDSEGNKLSQKALDPETILIIGSDSMFNGTEKEIEIKKKTFELFCRDSRNIKILTYDELYQRAKNIIERAEK